MLDFDFSENDVPGRGRPVPMPRLPHEPPTGMGRWTVLPPTGARMPDPFRFTGSVGPGEVSATRLDEYRAAIRELATDIGARWEQFLKDKGKL